MSLVRKFATVGSATLASRILGFGREAMMAAALGAGPIADAFYAAFRFPNLFRRLFAEGAFEYESMLLVGDRSQRVRLTRHQGQWLAEVNHPKNARSASLRWSISDPAGNTAKATISHAYGLK